MLNFISVYTGTGGGTDLGPLEGAAKSVSQIVLQVFGIVLPVLTGLIAILAIFKMIHISIKLSQAADDPEERSKMIKGLIWWGIGLVLLIAATALVPTLIFQIFKVDNSSGGGGGASRMLLQSLNFI